MQIIDNGTLRKFVDDVDGLHDALLHEAILLHPGYVDSDRRMFGDLDLLDGTLLFQSQSASIAAVKLKLRGISKFHLDLGCDFRLEGEVSNGEVVLYLCGKQRQDRCELRAKEVEYQLLDRGYLGPNYRLTKEELP